MEAQVDVLEGKLKALVRHRAAIAAIVVWKSTPAALAA